MSTSQRQLAHALRRVRQRLRQMAVRWLYQDRNADTKQSMLVAGTARSGTTWLGEIIGSQVPVRMLFEPFHPGQVGAFAGFDYFHYQRPTEDNLALANYSRQVFSGAIRHPWIDREVEHLRPACRVIKEIRANLFLKWLKLRFPEVPFVFILRHPCAVVLSRLELGWATDTDIQPFLDQAKLVQDFLGDKLEVVHRARTPAAKHAVVWGISNLVPLAHLQPGEAHGLFYEHLCTQAELEIPALFHAIGQPYTDAVFDRMQRASRTAVPASAVLQGTSKVARWQNTLTATQVSEIMHVVEGFGLTHVYDDSPLPLVAQPWAGPALGNVALPGTRHERHA